MPNRLPPITDRNDDGSPAAFFTHGEPCENCGKPCTSGTRIFVPGWNYWGCEDCAAEAAIMVFAEDTCPVLYDFVMRSKSVSEIQKAYQEHQESCPSCIAVVRKVAKWENEWKREEAA